MTPDAKMKLHHTDMSVINNNKVTCQKREVKMNFIRRVRSYSFFS